VNQGDVWDVRENGSKRKSHIRCIQARKHVTEKLRINFVSVGSRRNEPTTSHGTSDDINAETIKEIHICFGDIHCFRKGHMITEIKVKVFCTDANRTARIYANRCTTCDRYFLQYSAFKHYQDKHENLIVSIVPDEAYMRYDERGGHYFLVDLREESFLHILGYTTQVSDSKRRARLVTIMACNQMEKTDIVRHIDFLIRFGRNNPRHAHTIPKWQNDLEFVTDYIQNDRLRTVVLHVTTYNHMNYTQKSFLHVVWQTIQTPQLRQPCFRK
jgi:hypothetical protein